MLKIQLTANVNSGAALLLYLISLFGILFMVAFFVNVEKNIVAILTALSGSFGGFLVKRNSNNKMNLEAEKVGVFVQKGDPMS